MFVKFRTIDRHHEMLRINVKDGRLKSCGLAKVEDVHRACAEFLGEPIFLPLLNGIGMGHRQLKIKQRGEIGRASCRERV